MEVIADGSRKLPDISDRLPIKSLNMTAMIQHLRPIIDLLEREGIQPDPVAEEIGLVLPGQVEDPDNSSIVHGATKQQL